MSTVDVIHRSSPSTPDWFWALALVGIISSIVGDRPIRVVNAMAADPSGLAFYILGP